MIQRFIPCYEMKSSGLSVGPTCGSNIIQSSLNLPDKRDALIIDIKVS
ncbi:MAG TPA: hypothetical protein VFY64_11905 [Nitrososphaeraceae archaeon]|nr:hypothetical protein [Nitrososphaeraceae archaeon]